MIKGIENLSLRGKRVFIRVDFNVPCDEQGHVLDDARIVASLPTLRHALQAGARVILASHLGRPQGIPQSRYSLLPVAERLSQLLGQDVVFPEDCIGDAVRKLVGELRDGEVILLENLRFHPEEEKNDEGFSERLAALAEVYVNDAFGTLHRAHASTVGMVKFFKDKAAGKLVMEEIAYLQRLLKAPERPFVAILGGAKVSSKIPTLENLLQVADALLIGGAMAYTFLKAQGVEVGLSKLEESKVHQAKKILERAQSKGVCIELPVDHMIAKTCDAAADIQTTSGVRIPPGWMGLDIGPRTLESFEKKIQAAKTILWNGPMGVFEEAPFARGTLEIARLLARCQATTLVGGGDSLAAVQQAGVSDRMTHLSTGGGATLEFLEGKTLPGLQALESEAVP